MRAAAVAAVALALAATVLAQERLSDERARLLQRGEADLARDPASAVEEFELVAAMGHAADGELGLVRAYMQAGEYRRALAFCAHAAGEHFDVAGAAVLYAWLLRAGGQGEVAQGILAEALARAPSDALVLEAARAFASPPAVPDGVLLQAPHRVAPAEVRARGQGPVPQEARVVASGVLVGAGRYALVPTPASDAAPVTKFWVRNGLGETTEAVIDTPAASAAPFGVVLLRLRAPIASGGADTVAARAPFAGSPGFAVEYAEGAPATPAWPLLHPGFLGALSGSAGLRRLGIEVSAGSRGGPVRTPTVVSPASWCAAPTGGR